MSDPKRQAPTSFLAVFMDEDGEVQIGNQGVERDYIMWEHMLQLAKDKVSLKKHFEMRAAYMKDQQEKESGIIRAGVAT